MIFGLFFKENIPKNGKNGQKKGSMRISFSTFTVSRELLINICVNFNGSNGFMAHSHQVLGTEMRYFIKFN